MPNNTVRIYLSIGEDSTLHCDLALDGMSYREAINELLHCIKLLLIEGEQLHGAPVNGVRFQWAGESIMARRLAAVSDFYPNGATVTPRAGMEANVLDVSTLHYLARLVDDEMDREAVRRFGGLPLFEGPNNLARVTLARGMVEDD